MRIVSVAVIAVGLGIATKDVRNLPADWTASRSIGAPVEGHWYAVNAEGCFRSSNVYSFIGGEEYTSLDLAVYHSATDVEVSSKDGQIVMEKTIWDDNSRLQQPVEFGYIDHGQVLRATYAKIGDEHIDFTRSNSAPTLTLCGQMSPISRISLLWRTPFKWNAPTG